MSFELSFQVTENPDSLTCQFTDLTGDYNATTDPTGWGGPNPTKAAITAAFLDYLIPSATYEVGTTGGSIDLYDLGYPASLQQFTFASSDFGYTAGTEFADGPWQFTLRVSTATTEYEQVWTGMFINGFLCCADNQAKTMTTNPCNCDKITAAEKKLIRTQMNLAAVRYAERCQDVEWATIAMQRLNELCTTDADCGCS